MLARLPGGEFPSDYGPLLRWLIFTGVSAFGVALAWHFGLIRLMLASDKTHISAAICALYVLASLHCLAQTAAVSRELNSGQRAFALVRRGAARFRVVGDDVMIDGGVDQAATDETKLPPGRVTGHIRNLVLKAGLQGGSRFDQTLLLGGLADALRRPHQLGAFASDALMKLGLLGTIVGFILMLAPVAGLDVADHASVKGSMGLMSDGMAVAMYTTLTGLIGSILVQTQYYMLDNAIAKLFALATDLTEVFVVSVLDRAPDAQLR
ncbi:MAG TPA: MotA/TolQ/ExbB proton channel family protein [Xanthobacteraceae bacterium]|nr:MotA/TolQ/ExbB proton channel family protein [Xanthobacteraceae bacterium]